MSKSNGEPIYNKIKINKKDGANSVNDTENESDKVGNTSNSNDLSKSKLKEYKIIIKDLQNEIEDERNRVKDRTEENKSILSDIKQKINKCNKEIKSYSYKNEKQREKLQLISEEITQKINNISVNQVVKNLDRKKKSSSNKFEQYNSEKKLIDGNIDAKERQLINIITLITNYEEQNENLKIKIMRSKYEKDNNELLKKKLEQEKQIDNLNKKIKLMKTKILDHSKCPKKTESLTKKIEEIKNEIKVYDSKYNESKNKLTILENKKNRPKIIVDSNNNNLTSKTIVASRNNLNLKLSSTNKTEINKINQQIYKMKYNKINLQKKVLTQKKLNTEPDEDITKMYNLGGIFSDKELKAILIGLNNDKERYNQIIKKFNVYYSFVDSIETKHKMDLKLKLNKINELDDQILNMNFQKEENETNIELYKKQIKELLEQRNIYLMRNNELDMQVQEKKKIIERKNQEISLLGSQLIKLKKLLKKGDMKSIKNEPDVEIQYIDEEEENNLFKNNEKLDSYISPQRSKKIKFLDNNENSIKNIFKKNSNFYNQKSKINIDKESNNNMKSDSNSDNNSNSNSNSDNNSNSNSNNNSNNESNSNSNSNNNSNRNSNNNSNSSNSNSKSISKSKDNNNSNSNEGNEKGNQVSNDEDSS